MSENLKISLFTEKDKLFNQNIYPKPFSFNTEVAEVFDDMVLRSIPLYKDVLEVLFDWCMRCYEDPYPIVDIGCSTGTALSLLLHNAKDHLSLVGWDLSEAMLKKAQEKLSSHEGHSVLLEKKDICVDSLPECSVVILNYTLQFIPVQKRSVILQKIYQALRPGGILLMSEKYRMKDPFFQEMITYQYERFKHHNGYSHQEIARKKEALENVLVSFTYSELVDVLEKTGFYVEPLLMKAPFVTFLALKK